MTDETGGRPRPAGARLFLSAPTVRYRLAKVFVKLGISSRARSACPVRGPDAVWYREPAARPARR